MRVTIANKLFKAAVRLFPAFILAGWTGTALANTGAVFTATDPVASAGQNGVVMYNRAANGALTLTPGSPFLTGGYGVGADSTLQSDTLGSSGSMAVDGSNQFLFVVNAGSNQISVFRIHQNGLTLIETDDSGGVYPNSVAIRGTALYVLNAGGASNFQGFRLNPITGHLSPMILNGQCNLLPPLNNWPIVKNNMPEIFAIPSQISFSPDGSKLIVDRKEGPLEANILTGPVSGPGRFDVYSLYFTGNVASCSNPVVNINSRVSIPQGLMPYAFAFSPEGYLVSVEIIGVIVPTTPFKSSAMSSYVMSSSGQMKVITPSLPNGATAICWVATSGRYVYATNNLSDTISKYYINKNGTLTLLDAAAGVVGTPPPAAATGTPVDMAITADGHYLYQVVPGTSRVYAFSINSSNGNLTSLGAVAIPEAPYSGQSGIATADFS